MLRLELDDGTAPPLHTDEQFGTEPGCRVRQVLPALPRTLEPCADTADNGTPFIVGPEFWPSDRLGPAPTADFVDAADWALFVSEHVLTNPAVVFCVARYAALVGWHRIAFPRAVQQLVRLGAPTAMFDALASLAPASRTAAYMVRFVGLLSQRMVLHLVAYAHATGDACLLLELGPKRVGGAWRDIWVRERAVQYAERIIRDGATTGTPNQCSPRDSAAHSAPKSKPVTAEGITSRRAMAMAEAWDVTHMPARGPKLSKESTSATGIWYDAQLCRPEVEFHVVCGGSATEKPKELARLACNGKGVITVTGADLSERLKWVPRPTTYLRVGLLWTHISGNWQVVVGNKVIRAAKPADSQPLRLVANDLSALHRIPHFAITRLLPFDQRSGDGVGTLSTQFVADTGAK